MGLGGYLTWTAVAREIRKNIDSRIKVLPVEMHGNFIKSIKSDIFANNDDFEQTWTHEQFNLPLVLNNPKANYCKNDTPIQAVHRYDRHIIEQICEVYGIQNPELRCVINLTDDEVKNVDKLLATIPSDFIVIDVGVNKEYTQNKFDNVDIWQAVVDELPDTKFVQVGTSKDHRLKNVIDLVGKTTFRTAAGVIGRAKLFVGSEGGLVHAATAFNTPSVAVVTSFIHPTLVSYPGNSYVWLNDDDHGPCGMKVRCEQCHQNMLKLDHTDICTLINKHLNGSAK